MSTRFLTFISPCSAKRENKPEEITEPIELEGDRVVAFNNTSVVVMMNFGSQMVIPRKYVEVLELIDDDNNGNFAIMTRWV